VYRLNRDGETPPGQSPVFGANVLLLVYGDAFWPTYTSGDNTGLVATDSMKNFIHRETMAFAGDDLADYCRFLGSRFVATYPQAEGAQVSAVEVPFAGIDGSVAFTPAGPERATARVELRSGEVVDSAAGIRGFKLLRPFTASFATSTRRCRSCATGRCTCGWTSNGATSSTPRRSDATA
jgi:urate oxidase